MASRTPKEFDRVRFIKGPRGVKGKYGTIESITESSYAVVVDNTGGSVFSVPKRTYEEWFYSLGPGYAHERRGLKVKLTIR